MHTVAKVVVALSTAAAAAAASIPHVDQVKAGAILKVFHQAIFYPNILQIYRSASHRIGKDQCDKNPCRYVWSNAMMDLKVDTTITTKKAKKSSNDIDRDLKV